MLDDVLICDQCGEAELRGGEPVDKWLCEMKNCWIFIQKISFDSMHFCSTECAIEKMQSQPEKFSWKDDVVLNPGKVNWKTEADSLNKKGKKRR